MILDWAENFDKVVNHKLFLTLIAIPFAHFITVIFIPVIMTILLILNTFNQLIIPIYQLTLIL